MSLKELNLELKTLVACRQDNLSINDRIGLESAIWHVKGAIRKHLDKRHLEARLTMEGLEYGRFVRKLRLLKRKLDLDNDNRVIKLNKPEITVKAVKSYVEYLRNKQIINELSIRSK